MLRKFALTTFVAGVAFVAFAIFNTATANAASYDSLLGRAVVKSLNASRFESSPKAKPVYVRCYDNDAEFEKAGAWRFGESLAGVIAYAQKSNKTVHMRPFDCKLARQFKNDAERGIPPSKWATFAYSTLLHEALHVQGVSNERVTECLANDSIRWSAMAFGLPKQYANLASRVAWDMSAKYTGTKYHSVSGQCQASLAENDWTDYTGTDDYRASARMGSYISRANAVRQAKSYLQTMPFSLKGLVEQLEFEGYSTSDSRYGATHAGANWFVQAAKKAKSYLQTMPFSRAGLIEQLEFEGFTPAQARYGVRAVGL